MAQGFCENYKKTRLSVLTVLKNPAFAKNIQEEKLHLRIVLSSNDDSDDNYDN